VQDGFSYIEDIFQKELHSYTITNAIDDKNVLRFHIDYFRSEGKNCRTADGTITKQAVIEEILKKHNAATNNRRFNAILATASINEAIEYYGLMKSIQAKKQANDENFEPLNIACVFSPPSEGNKDVQQIQEDLPQEKADNQEEPDVKKNALKTIIADYNLQYGTNHSISEFDLYYQDVQKRIKDHKYSNKDYPRENKIDVTIVVDMLLTGFDAKYLNTLYVDKNLKYHGLIQAFSRTNRILNETKPYGNVLDFRGQKDAVDTAIARFSGEEIEQAKRIWLVDPAPTVVQKYEKAVADLSNFMTSRGLECKPHEVNNLKGDVARAEFINRFKEVQRLKTQLDQYTEIDADNQAKIDLLLPEDELRAFRGVYLETAQQLKSQRDKGSSETPPEVYQLDFEFVLFASTIIDYDYIMALIAKYSEREPSKHKITKEQLISLVASSANLIDERDNIVEYINSLDEVNGKTEKEVREGFQKFKDEKFAKELAEIAAKHELETSALQAFTDGVMFRMIFDGERLNDLFAHLELGWKARVKRELALMGDLTPFLKKLAAGREISGLKAYEE